VVCLRIKSKNVIVSRIAHVQVENVIVEIPFPKAVLNVMLTPTQGKYSFDPVTKVVTWDVGKIDASKLPNIRGTVS
jgi:AP-3 complex subunit mu